MRLKSPFILSIPLAGAALCGTGSEAADTPLRRPMLLCVLDRPKILQHSSLATNEAAHFQQLRQQTQAKFDSDSRALDADVRALESFRASLPAAAIKARSDDIARRRAELQSRGEQINRNLAQLDNVLTSEVMKAAAPLIRAVEQQRGCSLLVSRDTLLDLGDPDLDITAAVIERMNAAKPTDVPGS